MLILCDDKGHRPIYFLSGTCPLCDMHRKADALDEEITELKQEVHDLKVRPLV